MQRLTGPERRRRVPTMDPKKPTEIFMDVKGVYVGRTPNYPTKYDPDTKRQTGYKARWYSRRGFIAYEGSRRDTEAEAVRLAYRWFDKQTDVVDTTQTRASWNRKNVKP